MLPFCYHSVFGYAFKANGSRYAGFFALATDDEDSAAALQKQVPGTTVTVRYKFNNPDVSLLEDEQILGRRIIQNPHLLGLPIMWPRSTATNQPKDSPVVVLTLPDGRKLTLEELLGTAGTVNFNNGKLIDVTGEVRYEIIGSGKVPPEAASLHQQGREAGERGDHVNALGLFEQASELAPWPYPLYDKAFTHLLMHDFDAARICYEGTLDLSPRGFFMAITAVHTLNRERIGDLPRGTYLRFLSLKGLTDEAQKQAAVRELVAQIPQFAPAWKEFALLCDDDDERLAAIETGLAADPDAETKGMLEINKALALNLKGDRAAALQLLGELALNPESTFGTEHSAKSAVSILVMTPKTQLTGNLAPST